MGRNLRNTVEDRFVAPDAAFGAAVFAGFVFTMFGFKNTKTYLNTLKGKKKLTEHMCYDRENPHGAFKCARVVPLLRTSTYEILLQK